MPSILENMRRSTPHVCRQDLTGFEECGNVWDLEYLDAREQHAHTKTPLRRGVVQRLVTVAGRHRAAPTFQCVHVSSNESGREKK